MRKIIKPSFTTFDILSPDSDVTCSCVESGVNTIRNRPQSEVRWRVMCDVSVGVWTWTRFTMLLLTLLLCLSSCRSRAGFVTSASVTRVTTTEDEERNEDTVSVTEALDTGTSGPGLAPRLAPDQPRTFTGLVGQRADMEVAFCEDAGNGTASLEWSVAGVTLHPGTWYTPSVEGGDESCVMFV